MNMPVILCGLAKIFWVWEAMLTVFACYCFSLTIYRKVRDDQVSRATIRKQKGAWLDGFFRRLTAKIEKPISSQSNSPLPNATATVLTQLTARIDQGWDAETFRRKQQHKEKLNHENIHRDIRGDYAGRVHHQWNQRARQDG